MIPITDWGTAHPIFPIGGNGGDLFRVLAVNDNTQLFNGCDLITTLNAGEFFEEFYGDPFIMTSTEPVSVTAYTRGGDCSGNDTGDPNMRLLLPLERGNTDIRLRVENPLQNGGIFGNTVLHVLHLVMPTSDTGDLSLNGNPLPNWAPYPDLPEMSFSEIAIPDLDNEFQVLSDSPFWVELISLKSFDAFTMSLGSSATIELPPLNSTVVDLGADQSICPGETIVLDPGLGIEGIWQDGSSQETFTVTEPGFYSVTIEDGCGDGSDEVEITEGFVPSPELPIEITVCEGDNPQLDVNQENDVTYEWSTGETGPSIELNGFGLFTVTATSADGCEATASTNVLSGATAEVTIAGPESICEGEVTELVASSDADGSFLWDDGTVGSILNIDEGGNYQVNFTPDEGCEVSAQISVDDGQLPFVSVDGVEKCAGDVIQVGATSPNGDVFWPELSETAVAEITEAGIYEVAAENECGIATALVQVTDRDCSCPAYVPNVFTPNGDGLNDLFRPEILCEPESYELVIFNRWGRAVFSTNDFSQSWNGDSKINEEFFSPASTYTYILKYDNPLRPLQETVEVLGAVTGIR
jgi:gliding motility-associated-like protein